MIWVLAVVAVLVVFVVVTFNSLVKLRQIVNDAWSGIDVQLKRRYDLIPNLVETVKGYASHEKGTFEKVTEMRAKAISAQGPAEKAQAENFLTEALKSLFAVAENYPELKANQNFLDLQSQLAKLEEEIQFARRFYNGSVRELNTKVEQMPSNIIAGAFGFKKKDYFEAEATEKATPKVEFGASSGEESSGEENK